MSTLTDSFVQAQLSMAAYAVNLLPSMFGSDDPVYLNKLTAPTVGMSLEQAKEFADTYRVIDQIQDPTGFSATIFEDTNGVRHFAIRGTETTFFAGANDWLTNVADVGSDGIAIHQGLAMFNWLQRLVGGAGNDVVQYRYREAYLDEDGEVVPADVETFTATASGYLADSLSPMAVTGHSLGGHLAMMLSRLAPTLVGEVYTYNAPGFDVFGKGLTSTTFFNLLINATIGPLTGPIASGWNASIMTHLDVPGDVVHGIGFTLGESKPIFSESRNEGVVAAHDIIALTDALAIYSLFSSLSSTVSVDTITNILKAASHTKNTSDTTDETLETALDALRVFIADYQQGTSTATVAPTIRDNRDSFYTNLLNFQNEIKGLSLYNETSKSLGLSVASLVGADTGVLFNNAKQYDSVRYALAKLNPFTITGNPALYDQINFDGSLDLYNPATSTGTLTDQYLQDRSAFLYNKILSGNADASTRSGDAFVAYGGAPQIFEDKASDPSYKLYLGKDKTVSDIPADEMTRIRFGAVGADQLYGSTQWDHLYGMDGADTLTGGKGNDYLEGGKGTDTYVYNSGDGLDTILDTDGFGKITFDGVDLNGGEKLFGDTYRSTDGKYLYTLLQKTTGQDLLISAMGGQIIVKDFQSGELGIALNDSTAPAPTSEFHGTNNNDADLIDSGIPIGVAGGGVLDTNWQGYAAYGQVLYHDADDVGGMFFLSRFGQPYPANTVFDALYGEGGDSISQQLSLAA